MEEALKLLLECEDIPEDIKDYAKRCVEEDKGSRLLDAINNAGDSAINELARLFKSVSRILGVKLDDVACIGHYSPLDLDETKSDSFLAELRCVVFLEKCGFARIAFVPETSDPRPDLRAELNGKQFIIEVATADRDSTRVPTEGLTVTLHTDDDPFRKIEHGKRDSLYGYCRTVYEKKYDKGQLSWHPEGNSPLKMMVFVLNNLEVVALGTRATYENTLKELYEQIGRPQDMHFAIITNQWNGVTGESDDCIWPPLS